MLLLLALLLAAPEPPRLHAARALKEASIRALFAGRAYPPRQVLLRAFKEERALELWTGSPLELVKSYRICASSGTLGPKRRGGDGQVPEGFYEISGENPSSNFLLSLHVSYPNSADRILGARNNPGGDIFIHGNCVTIGCIPIEDAPIQELYVIVHDARAAGARVAVHILPVRMDDGEWAKLSERARGMPDLLAFWENLREGYRFVEEQHAIPRISVNAKGRYLFGSH